MSILFFSISDLLETSIDVTDQDGKFVGKFIIEERDDGKYDLSLKSSDYSAESSLGRTSSRVDIKGSESNSIKSRLGYVENSIINTQVFAVENATVDSAEITVEKFGDVENIYKCVDFDVDAFSCNEWTKTDIPFTDNGDTITFEVDSFSGFGGGVAEGWPVIIDVNSSYDQANDVVIGSNDTIYIVGRCTDCGGNPNESSYIAKLDSNGTLLWTNISRLSESSTLFSDESVKRAVIGSDNNLYTAGYCFNCGIKEGRAIQLRKLDPDGNKIWTNVIDSNSSNGYFASDLAIDSSNNIYVAGYCDECGNKGDKAYYISKFNSDGDNIWTNITDPSTGPDRANGIDIDSNNNIYVTGVYEGNSTMADNSTIKDDKILTMKFDSNGNHIWTNITNPSFGNDEGKDITVDSNNNVYVAGYCYGCGNNGSRAYYTIKFDSQGNHLWTNINDLTSSLEESNAIISDSENNIYVTGYCDGCGNDSSYAMLTIALKPDGSHVGTNIENPTDNHDSALGIDADSNDNIYVAGYCGGCGDKGGNAIYITKYLGNKTNETEFNLSSFGDVMVELVEPVVNTDVDKNVFFNFTVNVSCLSDDCGEINVSLDPERYEIAVFSGVNNTNALDADIINVEGSAVSLKFDDADYDETYFNFDSSAPGKITINEAGDYLLAFTLPLNATDTANSRNRVESSVYVNGMELSGATSRSSYIRNAYGHTESSNHFTVLLEGLSVGDNIEVRANATTNQQNIPVKTSSKFTLYAEYIPETEIIFSAVAENTTNSEDLNQDTPYPMVWTESISDEGYINNGTHITLEEAGSYLVFVNIPLLKTEGNIRQSVKGKILLDGAMIEGGEFKQGYIRSDEDGDVSSIHYSGAVQTSSANQSITITAEQEAAVGVVTTGDNKATIYIQKLPDSGVYLGRGWKTTGGIETNWNLDTKESVKWEEDAIIDSSVYMHNTSTNAHEVIVNEDGDYLAVFNVPFSSTGERSNPKITLDVRSPGFPSAPVEGAETKTNYIRKQTHDESSSSLVFLIRDLSAGDTVFVNTIKEANSAGVSATSNASLLLWKKEKSVKSGLVSTTIGDTPFYTTADNPYTVNLSQNETALVTWPVKSTGDLETVHEFFSYAALLMNTNIINETNHLNLTIVDTISPEVNLVSPSNNKIVTTNTEEFVCNFSDLAGLSNAVLYIWDSTGDLVYNNMHNLSGTENQTSWNYTFTYNDVYGWNCLVSDSSGNDAMAVSNNTLNLQMPILNVSLVDPDSDTSWEKNTFNSFTVNVSCEDYDCGSVDVILDPIPDFANSMSVVIDNSDGISLANNSVRFLFDSKVLISGGSMQPNCSDIRFLDSNDTELNYWLDESTCNTTNTSVWIKVPSIPSDTKESIYMYYGNSSVESASYAPGVFPNNNINHPDLSVYDSVLYVDSASGDDTYGNGSFSNPYESLVKAMDNDGDNTAIYLMPGNYSSVVGAGVLDGDMIGALGGKVIVHRAAKNEWGRALEITNRDHNYYNIIFEHDPLSDSSSYYFGDAGSSAAYQTFYNCVFKNKYSIYNDWYFRNVANTVYNNTFENFEAECPDGSKYSYNSVFDSHGVYSVIEDSLFLNQITKDEDWRLTSGSWQDAGAGTDPDGSPADIGVYGGKYAWGYWGPETGSQTKGMVSTTVGDTPFYTTTDNPYPINLNAGESQEISWSVNATGNLNVAYEFFVYANLTSDSALSRRTDNVYITISDTDEGGGSDGNSPVWTDLSVVVTDEDLNDTSTTLSDHIVSGCDLGCIYSVQSTSDQINATVINGDTLKVVPDANYRGYGNVTIRAGNQDGYSDKDMAVKVLSIPDFGTDIQLDKNYFDGENTTNLSTLTDIVAGYQNESDPLHAYSNSVYFFSLERDLIGKVTFEGYFSFVWDILLSASKVIIEQGYVSVDSDSIFKKASYMINHPRAKVELYNINPAEYVTDVEGLPIIYKDEDFHLASEDRTGWTECGTGCDPVTWNSTTGTLTFYVDQFSSYTLGKSGDNGGPAVPEFSTAGIILALLVAGIGAAFIIKKRGR